MSRYLLFVLLATGLALADKKPKTEHSAPAAEEQAKTDAVAGQKQEAHAKTTVVPERTAEAQAEVEQAKEATEHPPAQTDKNGKLTSVPDAKALGMSILGNQEAPTALVIVPWKSSEVGRSMGISPMLDDSRQPVDKEVFTRELRYYEIRSETKK
jgi:hypothetical protein